MDPFSSPAELPLEIAAAVGRGATVVTGNQRAARTLRLAYDRGQRAQGLKLWQPPNILAWESWTAGLWHRLLIKGRATAVLLSRSQEHIVWHEILAEARREMNAVQSTDSLAELAAEAWSLSSRYQAGVRVRQAASSFENRSYLRWTSEFERRCRERGWLPSSALDAALEEIAEQSSLGVAKVVLTGFDDMTPARRSLLDRMQASGTVVMEHEITGSFGAAALIAAATAQEEMESAARWAKAWLERRPDARLAIIVPSLETQRSAVDRTLRRVLAPQAAGLAGTSQPMPYEFSVGTVLSDTSLVRGALQLLQWAAGPLPMEQVSSLLVSSLLASTGDDLDQRAIFDALVVRKAKHLLQPFVSLEWLLELSSASRGLPAKLGQALRHLHRTAVELNLGERRAGFSIWVECFRRLLEAAEWRSPSEGSAEFQLRRRWDTVLDEVASLDLTAASTTYTAALATLQRQIRATTFAPESHEAPIQVMGPLESAGDHFDGIWFTGGGDRTWPARRSFHPLLPWSVQSDMGMPGELSADTERSRHVLSRILRSAPQVIFSYALEAGSDRQRPSALIQEALQETTPFLPAIAEPIEPATIALESFRDAQPIAALPDHAVRGGSQILQLQAACPFRAFAERRLQSSELREVVLGLDPMERGNIVHRALELFWREVQQQSILRSMGTEDRALAIRTAIDGSTRRPREQDAWEKAYLEVQRERLRRLLRQWIEVELAREPFHMKHTEKKHSHVRIGPLQIEVRVDRVDSTDAGDVVIDYKTGSVKIADWFGERPDAPQLPLYAVVQSDLEPESPVADIAFARIQAGDGAVFQSYAGTASAGKLWAAHKRRGPIELQIDEWREVLTRLAESFARGEAEVDPKRYPSTCKHCEQRTLCRLNPALLNVEDDDESS